MLQNNGNASNSSQQPTVCQYTMPIHALEKKSFGVYQKVAEAVYRLITTIDLQSIFTTLYNIIIYF